MKKRWRVWVFAAGNLAVLVCFACALTQGVSLDFPVAMALLGLYLAVAVVGTVLLEYWVQR